MELIVKFVIYVLIISSSVDYALFRALPQEKRVWQRIRRQVVQPTWLQGPDDAPGNPHPVRVNAQSLKEAATIRGAIQQAVDEGQYAVSVDNSNINPHDPIAPVDAHQNARTEPNMQPSVYWPPAWAHWTMPWQNNAWSQFRFMDDVQRMWLEFVNNSRRFFNWNQ